MVVQAKLRELQELKVQVKQLLPEREAALESEGGSTSSSCQSVIHIMFVRRIDVVSPPSCVFGN